MNRSLKSKNNAARILVTATAILLIRWGLLLAFSFAAYLGNDPGASVSLFSTLAKLIGEFVCGIITAKALKGDFSTITKITLAAVVSLILNAAELIIGKAVFPEGTVSAILLPFAVAVCALGAMLASRKKKASVKRRKRK